MEHQSNFSTHISDLPDELLSLIFRCLRDYCDRESCSLVCRNWLLIEARSRQRLSLINNWNLKHALAALFSRFHSVTRLVITSFTHAKTNLDNAALTLISLECRNLKTLKLYDNSERYSPNAGMAALGTNTRLKKFSCRNSCVATQGLNTLLSHSSTLEIISVKDLRSFNYSSFGLVYPGAAESSLISICLKDIRSPNGPKCFAPLICGSKNLRTLKLSRCLGDWDRVLLAFRENVSLCEVYLDKVQVSDVGLSALWTCSKLEIIHIERLWACTNSGITNSGIESLVKHCKSLTKIQIEN